MNDKVAGADVVGQVRDELVAERVVANILDDAACIGVRASLFQLCRGNTRIPAAQQRHDRTLPGKVDQLFVGEERISTSGPAGEHETQKQNEIRGPEEITHPLQYRRAPE